MRFCMVTTFFGAQSFGGDAAYVDRLSRALARRGHEVDVIHSADAFSAAGGTTPRAYTPPHGVRVHTIRSRAGWLAPLWSHQTGTPPPRSAIVELIGSQDYDAVHFHNISLVGGPGILHARDRSGRAAKLMTAHEHFLVCPLHILWKYEREICEREECVRCSLHAHRPVQLWRYGGARDRALAELDALVCPSRHTIGTHAARGIRSPMTHLPYFLPDDWGASPAPAQPRERPYFIAAGRLIKAKGFQDAIEVMRELPQADLLVAGSGPFEPELRRVAAGLANVELVGHLDEARLARMYADATAAIVPSQCYETFGYVCLEAFSRGTPVVVRRLGALAEIAEESGGALTFETQDELRAALVALLDDPALRRRLGEAGEAGVRTTWSEAVQVDAYLDLVASLR